VEDHDCWKDIKTGYVLRDVNKHEEKLVNIPYREEGYDPMRSLERRLGGMVTSENHVWIT